MYVSSESHIHISTHCNLASLYVRVLTEYEGTRVTAGMANKFCEMFLTINIPGSSIISICSTC